jgi:hypothetical protein
MARVDCALTLAPTEGIVLLMNTLRNTKSAIKAALLRCEALEAELAEIRESNRPDGVKSIMWANVWAAYNEAADRYEAMSGKTLN